MCSFTTSEIKNRFYLKSINLLGSEIRTLFSSEEIICIILFINNGLEFIFEKNCNGLSNIFIYRNGEIFNLTPNTNSYFLKLDKVNNLLYFESNNRDLRFMDIYKIDLLTKKRTLCYYNDDGDTISCISDKGSYIIVNKIDRISEKRYLEIIKTGEDLKKKLNIVGNPQFFDKEGKHVYLITTFNHEFQYLQKICLKTLKVKAIFKHNWDIIFSFLSHSNRYLLYVTNENGNYKLNIYDNINNILLDIQSIPSGTIKSLSLSINEKTIAVLIESSNYPANIYLFDLENLTTKKITSALSQNLKQNLFTKGRPKVYKTKYNSLIYGQLYLPENKINKLPLIILVHGGPGGQSILNFDILTQVLCLNGYAVFSINHRGSSGYGIEYLESINLKHGIEDLKDCIEIKEILKMNPNIDANNTGIIGISYGAFLSFSALTFYPDQFKFSICLFGVYNWVHTLSNLPKSWENYKEVFFRKIGHPIKDKEHLINISPYYHLENVVNPALFISGGRDLRNNEEDLDYIVSILNKKKLAEHLHYEDEGHGLNNYTNIVGSYLHIISFIKRNF